MPPARAREPLVLVSTDYRERPGRPAGRFMAFAPSQYFDAVRLAGGLPLLAPPMDEPGQVRRALARCRAVLLIGGLDLDPAGYGQKPHPGTRMVHRRRDRSDLLLAREAARAGKPLLGICGGMQALNVALGGTLHQHVPDLPGRAGREPHLERLPESRHAVLISPGSRLARILGGRRRLTVNSAHHQAVARPGRGLRVSARSPGGLIEGLEGPAGGAFLLGVQWHPERLAVRRPRGDGGARPGPGRRDALAVFRALVAAASGRR